MSIFIKMPIIFFKAGFLAVELLRAGTFYCGLEIIHISLSPIHLLSILRSVYSFTLFVSVVRSPFRHLTDFDRPSCPTGNSLISRHLIKYFVIVVLFRFAILSVQLILNIHHVLNAFCSFIGITSRLHVNI